MLECEISSEISKIQYTAVEEEGRKMQEVNLHFWLKELANIC